MPPAIKNLLLINATLYLVGFFNSSLHELLISKLAITSYGLFSGVKIWQPITYMFVHYDFWHVGLNMFILWMFGVELEREWGTKEFIKYYFITGIGAGLIGIFLMPAPFVMFGASGAVFGIMLAFALRYPDRMVYVYFLFPVKVKYLMGFFFLISFFSTFGSTGDGIAHAAHLGGIVVGFIYLKYWKIHFKIKQMLGNISVNKQKKSNLKYTKGGDNKTEYYRRVIDELLDKINRVGYLNLTEEEKKLLEEGSKYLREHDAENFN